MHELSFVQQVFSTVKSYACNQKAKRVIGVDVSVSVLSGIENESFQFYWDIIAKKSIMEDCQISIKIVPIHVRCTICNSSFILHRYEDLLIQCIKCHSMKVVVSEQTSVTIDAIHIET